MPDPDKLLRTLEQAAQAFQNTPGRTGRLIRMPDASDVLVAGDMHGNLTNFRHVLERADLVNHPRRHLILQEVVHGPHRYPAGGDKSHQLLDLLAALKCQYPDRVHFLLGNHELAQWAGHLITKIDFEQTTLFRFGVEAAYGSRAAEVYGAYRALFMRAAVAVCTPNRVFCCHSLPWFDDVERFDLAVLEAEQPDDREFHYGGVIHSLVWGRDLAPETAAAFCRRVDADLLVTGHVPCSDGHFVPNERQVVLDSHDSPAALCLFPADRPLTHRELVACVETW